MVKVRVEARYEAVREDIKKIARKQMRQQGTASIGLRAIAREMNITAPAIYRYFPSLDDLITALIVDAFNDLADALEMARDLAAADSAVMGLRQVMFAYRHWALAHPIDFQLIYGNPIPGYEAPREVTVPAVVRGFAVIVVLIERALQSAQGAFKPPYDQVPPEFEPSMQAIRESDNYPVSTLALYLGITGWTYIHGMIMLELFNHLQPTIGDAGVYYRVRVDDFLRAVGLIA